MNDLTGLLLKIGASVALVCFFYFLFSYISAAVISHQTYVMEASDWILPVTLGVIVEFNDISKYWKARKGEGSKDDEPEE